MKINKMIIAAVVTAASALLAVSWESSYNSAVKQATKSQSPILMYFYSDKQQKSREFDAIIRSGLIDFLSDTFIMLKLDVDDPASDTLIKKFSISQIPVFILEDYEPERSTKMDPIIISADKIFFGLYELYSGMTSNYVNLKQYDHAYGCLKLIEKLPGEMGENVRQNLKELEPKVTKKASVKDQNKNHSAAESYMKTAENSLKNNNYEKAYIYFSKVVELVPGSEDAGRAEVEMKKLEDKIDRSVILKK